MRGFLLFDLGKEIFLLYLSIKLSWEVEILYIYLVEGLNVPFGCLDLSASMHLLAEPKMWLFGWVFSFFEFFKFVPRTTPLHVEVALMTFQPYCTPLPTLTAEAFLA